MKIAAHAAIRASGERWRKIQKPFRERNEILNEPLITASDVHFMMMIYDDAPNTYTRMEFYEWIHEYYVHAQGARGCRNKLPSETL